MTTEPDGVSAMSAELGGLPPTRYTLASGGSFTWTPGYDAAQVRAFAAQAVEADNELMWRALKALVWTAPHMGVMADEARQVIEALQARLGHPTPSLCGPQGPHQQGSEQG